MSPTIAQYAAVVEQARAKLAESAKLHADGFPGLASAASRMALDMLNRLRAEYPRFTPDTNLGTGPFTWPDIVVIDKRTRPPTDAPPASTMGDLLAALERGEHLGIRCHGDVTSDSLATLARDLLRLSLVILNRSEEIKVAPKDEKGSAS